MLLEHLENIVFIHVCLGFMKNLEYLVEVINGTHIAIVPPKFDYVVYPEQVPIY